MTNNQNQAKKPLTKDDRLYYFKRSTWFQMLMTRPDVSHAAFRVAYFVIAKAGHDKKYSYWKVSEIALQVGCSTKTVSDATAFLEKANLLHIRRRPRSRNEYAFRLPNQIDQSAEDRFARNEYAP